MTKKEIVKTLSERTGLPQNQAKELVEATFEVIMDILASEGRIELRNFGVFAVKQRRSRRGRNPRTGDDVKVPAKYVVTFKPGREMEQRVKLIELREGSNCAPLPASSQPCNSLPHPFAAPQPPAPPESADR